MMRVAIVYLGNNAPKYVFDNLRYLRTNFPNINLVFISDSDKSLNLAKKIGAEIWYYHENVGEKTNFQKNSSLPMNFRAGFWYTTTSRFFAIENYMENHSGEQLLQIEADVWISPNFPFEKFKDLPKDVDIAFPLETEITGAASILYLRDANAARNFCLEVRKDLLENSGATDMTILGKISKDRKLHSLVLPVVPYESGALNPETSPGITQKISQSLDYFGGVFDSVTYGLYLAGEDPRNHRGMHYRFRRQASHLVYCDKIKFVAKSDGIYLCDTTDVPLFNLHIHSKDRSAWRSDYLKIKIPLTIQKSKEGVSAKRNYGLLLALIAKSLKRRIGI
jgi:hypothetical protein